MTRLEELQSKGWANLKLQEREEYQELRKATTQPLTEEEKKYTLKEICEKLYLEILDGNSRATVLAYKDIQSNESLLLLLTQLMNDLKSGEDKGKVYRYIQELSGEGK